MATPSPTVAAPPLHGYWLKRYGIKGHYIPIDIAPVDLSRLLRTLPELGFVGCNVTIPHKEAILQIADVVTDRAALIGAANTLIFRKDGKIHADNTDGSGFIANLRQNAPDWKPAFRPRRRPWRRRGRPRCRRCSLIEAAPEIHLANRTRARADAIRQDFGAEDPRPRMDPGPEPDGRRCHRDQHHLARHDRQGRVPSPLHRLNPGALCNDLVYTPLKTQFLIEAEERGHHHADGLGMLLHQAAPGFERWFGTRPEVDEATRKAVLSA